MEQNAVIEQVLALTRDMEHAASLADWPEAARLAELRSPLIMSLDAQQAHASGDALRSVLARNAAMLADAQTSQRELEAEYSAAMKRVNAVGQYQKTALL
ncbi:flagellar protein FliT [Paraburkholderia sp. PREW-6R]|uniref:flagellar protein FliT n=1 Tax=Paraburkholderia sp. PREW-6R TaxID=3141544 RepID=UPI0031F4E6AA